MSAEPGSLLARLRCSAHGAFDPMWKSGYKTRTESYVWLAAKLGIAVEDCHILKFDEQQCLQVIKICLMEAFDVAEVAVKPQGEY